MRYAYEVVNTEEKFESMLRHLETQAILAVDTETVGLKALELWQQASELENLIESRTYQVSVYEDEYAISKRNKALKEVRDTARKALKTLIALHKKTIQGAAKNPGALDFWRNQCASVQIGVDAEDNYGTYLCYLIRPQVIDGDKLGRLLNSRRQLLFQNAKFDWKVIRQHLGITLHCLNLYDTRLAEYLINSGRELSSSLKEIVKRRFGYVMDKTIALSNWAGKWSEEMMTYAAEDVAYLFEVKKQQLHELTAFGLYGTFKMECLLTASVGRMEMNGIALDMEELNTQAYSFQEDCDSQRANAIAALNGANPSSPLQVKEALLAQGIAVKATGEKELKAYESHPTVRALLDFRSVSKLYSTYYIPLQDRAVPSETGFRIHANFNTAITDTGRLSSSDPNLQNQPAKGNVRKVFIPTPGWKLVVGDLSQIEMRILAHVTQDRNLLKAFQEDIDVHTLAAAMVFSVPYHEVSRTQRGITKAIQFGLVYGKTEFGLASDLGISQRKALAFIKRYFRGYKGVERFINRCRDRAHVDGFVRTLGGRIRHMDGLKSTDKWLRSHCERASVNTVIQGTAADGMKRSLIYIDEAIVSGGLEDRVRLVCNVHDEVVVEVRDDGPDFIAFVVCLVRDNLIRGTQELIPTVPVKVGNEAAGWTCSVVSTWAESKG